MANSKIRFGIIGAGGIAAKLHLPELTEMRARAEVTLISGRRQSRLDALRAQFPFIRGDTIRYEDVIESDSVDAVIIGTPHTHHVNWGIEALKAGKHVLMQKPLCADMEEANAFVAAADASDRTVLVMPHFDPPVYAFRKRVAEGRIGTITAVRARTAHGGPDVYYREVAQIFGEPEPEDLWFFDSKQASVGALFDMGVYAVANVVAHAGAIKTVQAITATVDKPTDLEDSAALLLRSASGAIATAETSWCDGARTWEVSLHGTHGKLVQTHAGLSEHIPLAFDSDHAEIERRSFEPGSGVGNVHEHFLDCITRGEQPPLSNARAARHVTEILLAALESGRSGKTVRIESTL